jgi:hypothetical protein
LSVLDFPPSIILFLTKDGVSKGDTDERRADCAAAAAKRAEAHADDFLYPTDNGGS